MFTEKTIAEIKASETPCYVYDMTVLNDTLKAIKEAAPENNYKVHYAVKANFNPGIIETISKAGLGVDAVSGGELRVAIDAGFDPKSIVFAGVGKRDDEIRLALELGIGCFNVESLPELEIISQIATDMGVIAPVALRMNPGIDAHTHKYITTGLTENKFGINIDDLPQSIEKIAVLSNIELIGLHFHIGSQITINKPYELLCHTINRVVTSLKVQGINLRTINVGGGLGVDYANPDANPVPDFKTYFDTFRTHLRLEPGQELHFELGRSIVAQCGSLLTRVLFVKQGAQKQFAIIDAGFTELIRPVLYQAQHRIDIVEGGDANNPTTYDIVGPICESTDTFVEDHTMPQLQRGDILAIRSAGAYGESMSMRYNCRDLKQSLYINQ